MTVDEVRDLREQEMKKLDALEKIVAILETLGNDVDCDAVDWVKEKIAE